jgi:hypothetical protein
MAWSRLKAKFLKPFSMLLRNSTIDLPLSADIQSGEDFTRFIFTQKHFSVEKKRVKPQALLPIKNKTTGRLETFTHRIRNPGVNTAQWR